MIIRYTILILGLMASGSFQMMRGEAHQKYLRTTDPADLKVMRRISQLELMELKAELRGIERCPVCRWYAPRAHKRMKELKDLLVAFDDALANPEKPEEKPEKKRASRSRSKSPKKTVLPDQELEQESQESIVELEQEPEPEKRVLRSRSKSRSKSPVRFEEVKQVLPEQKEQKREHKKVTRSLVDDSRSVRMRLEDPARDKNKENRKNKKARKHRDYDGEGEDEEYEEEYAQEKAQKKQMPQRVTRSRSPERNTAQLNRNHEHPSDRQTPMINRGMFEGLPWDFWPYTVSTLKPAEDEALLRERWKAKGLPKEDLELGLVLLQKSYEKQKKYLSA